MLSAPLNKSSLEGILNWFCKMHLYETLLNLNFWFSCFLVYLALSTTELIWFNIWFKLAFYQMQIDKLLVQALTFSWRRPLSYRNQSIDLRSNQWTGFYMITASVMKGLSHWYHELKIWSCENTFARISGDTFKIFHWRFPLGLTITAKSFFKQDLLILATMK